ncbi:MAG: M3 family oligoendopeptidase, partial [Planctomycetota bacterium]
HKHTLSAALQAGIKRDVFYARAKNHTSARAAALFRNNVPEAVYDNLIEAVHENLGGLYKYYELRRELLGLDEIHFYDLFVSVVPDLKMRHTYEEAVAKIIAALAPLGEEYTSTLNDGLLGGWVDRYENRGKRSGAYSSGCYDSDPFILMNFKADSLEHTYTLAHEAGHSMHSHYSKKQLPQNADYSIFVAEVASTFNEALLTHYMLETTDDPKMRAFIINREIDGLRGTLFRQTMFAEFEKVIHAKAEANEPLSLDVLTGAYHEILERYYGPDFTLDAELDLECLRIPHFYYNFYVFQYATGISAAIALAKKVIAGEEGALERYIGFLSAGGSKFPIDVLKDAGVDMTQKDAVAAALEHFNARVDELKALRESGAF